jgi:D-sedoheptulose 7-phosphate isomerase
MLKASTLLHLDTFAQRHPALTATHAPLVQAAAVICRCHASGGMLLVCGNGGSAADSEHIVGELVKTFILHRAIPPIDTERLREQGCDDSLAAALQQGVRAIALTTNSALLTAICNDTDACMIFAQQVYVYGRPGDVLLALSTSGNSQNVVNAVKVGRAFGLHCIGLTGGNPSAMDDLCHTLIKVPATETLAVQEYHLPIYHVLCQMIEEQLFGT